MAGRGAYNVPRLMTKLRKIHSTPGKESVTFTWDSLGRLLATLEMLPQTPVTNAPPVVAPGVGGTSNIPTPGTVTGGGSPSAATFRKFFYPSDIIGSAASIGGRVANAYYKSKAAKQMARGNAAQHLAASMSTPQSQAIFGSPLSGLAKLSADAGQAKATQSLAQGEAWQGSLQDIANFISSINTMRRLMSGDALSAMGLIAMQRMATANHQRGP
jgi:hypothetical protein